MLLRDVEVAEEGGETYIYIYNIHYTYFKAGIIFED